MEESVFSQSPFSNESPASSSGGTSRRGKKLLFLIVLLIILGLIAFGAVKFLGGNVLKGSTPTPTPTMMPTPTDTPTPTPALSGTPTPSPKAGAKETPTPSGTVDKTTGIDRSTVTVAVQNGSGIAGAAAKGADFLKGLGYTIGTVGNAPTSDYATTEIHVKAGKAALLTLLKKDLSANYTVGTAASDYTGSGDALVIVGKQ